MTRAPQEIAGAQSWKQTGMNKMPLKLSNKLNALAAVAVIAAEIKALDDSPDKVRLEEKINKLRKIVRFNRPQKLSEFLKPLH